MELSTPELVVRATRVDKTFEFTESLPRARFGSERFMWGSLALTVLAIAWMSCR